MKKVLIRMLSRLRDLWDRGILFWSLRVPPRVTVVILAIITGVGAGCMAALIKYILGWLVDWFELAVHDSGQPWRLLIYPLAGLCLVTIYQLYIIRRDLAHGTARIRHILRDSSAYKMSPRIILGSLLACSATIGFGSSAGSEGPTAYSSASLGSNLGRFFKLSPEWVRMLIAIGAGAGIAGIFKSPIGGTLYTLEVLQMEVNTVPVLALITACLVASTTAFMLSGYSYDIAFSLETPFDPTSLGWVALLGIICGLYSLYYTWSRDLTARFLNGIGNRWIRTIITGCGMSLAVFYIPALFGEGFGVIQSIINGELLPAMTDGLFDVYADNTTVLLIATAAILVLKGSLVAGANCAGVAGDFVPALFIGGVAGYLFATLMNMIFGLTLPIWYLCMAGMGAVLACVTHAPLMAIFILTETTNTFQFIPAYMLAVAVAYAVVKLISPWSTMNYTGHDDLNEMWDAAIEDQDAMKIKSEAKKPQDQK